MKGFKFNILVNLRHAELGTPKNVNIQYITHLLKTIFPGEIKNAGM